MKRIGNNSIVLVALTASLLACANPGSDTTTKTLSSAKALTSFSLVSPAVAGTLNESARTVSLSVPAGTAVTSLVASFVTTGKKVSARVASSGKSEVAARAVAVAVTETPFVDQVSGTTANNFTSPLVYRVTAEDGTTTDYTVTVIVGSLAMDQF